MQIISALSVQGLQDKWLRAFESLKDTTSTIWGDLGLGEPITTNTDGLLAELTTTLGIVLWEPLTFTTIDMYTVQSAH